VKASTVNPDPGGTPALAVRGLSVAYGDMVAVREATFSIAPGEACAVTGPNGNGKSSLLIGHRGPGPPPRRRGDLRQARARRRRPVGGTPRPDAGTRTPPALPGPVGGRQHRAGLLLLDVEHPEGSELTLVRPRPRTLPGNRTAPAPAGRTLSGGQQQMVAIMRGLASDPKILAVDEPCLGLAEAVSRRVYDALARIHAAGTTLVVVEEAPKRALSICDRRVEVRNGVASAR
jgi:branched-chain amino acid transport system ATP-binding protein